MLSVEKQKSALENALMILAENGIKDILLYHFSDAAPKFYLMRGTERVTPILAYNELNHFIFGMIRACNLIKNNRIN